MKVFLSFQNSIRGQGDTVMPAFYESFINGLRDAGNEVLAFHAYLMPYGERPKTTARIRQAITRFAPDLIVAFNNFGPDFSSFYDGPIWIYEVDSPLYYDCTDAIRAHPDRYFYFICQEDNRAVLREWFGIRDDHIVELPFFTEMHAEELPKRTNILFVGSRFVRGEFHWHKFRKSRTRSMEDVRAYREILDEIRANPFLNRQALVDRHPALGLDKQDVETMVNDLSAERRIGILSAVADLGLEYYGTSEWLEAEGEDAELYLRFNPRKIYALQDVQDLYNASKICLNVNHLQARSTFSWRVADIMATTGCLVSEEKANLKIRFPHVPIPTFTNKFEAREQCRKLLTDPARRADISALSRQVIDESFRLRNVLDIIEDATGTSLRQKTAGSVSYLTEGAAADRGSERKPFSLAWQCLKLAACQMPLCGRLFNEAKLVDRIKKYARR